MKTYIRFAVIVLLLVVFNDKAFSQGQMTTQGKEFWVSFGNNAGQGSSSLTLQIRIVTTNATWVRYKFTETSVEDSVYLGARQLHTIDLSATQRAAVYRNYGGQSLKSLYVTSDENISLFALNQASATTDATNILPTNNYGQAYYHISYNTAYGQDGYTIIANENNTTVRDNGAIITTLNRGQVYSYYATSGIDLTGHSIISDKPIAYFLTRSGANVPSGTSFSDCLFQQLIPVFSWGNNFLVPVTKRGLERVRIVASQDGTIVNQNGGTLIAGSLSLNTGQSAELEISLINNGCFISSNKPIGVATVMMGSSYSPLTYYPGDPSLSWVPPIEQTVMDVSIAPFSQLGSTQLTEHYALIVTPTLSKNSTIMTIGNGSPQILPSTGWRDNTASGFSFYSLTLTNDVHYFENAAGLSIVGYGLGDHESYYYLAASSARQLNPAFYINDIHFQDADGQTYCNTPFVFRAVIHLQMHPDPGHLRWYIDGVEEISARDQMQWTKPSLSLDTPHEIKMVLLDIFNQTFTLTSTITVVDPQKLQISGTPNICPPATSVELTATSGPGRYQWYNNGTPILGETHSTYSATAAGNYTVIGYYGTCATPLSDPFNVNTNCVEAIDDYIYTFINSPKTVDILGNDNLATCSVGTLDDFIIVDSPKHGLSEIVNDSMRYTPDPDFVGFDTVKYYIRCNSGSSTAYVYIKVLNKPDNLVDVDCYIDPPATTWGIREIPMNTAATVDNYGPLMVGDIDGDGIVEIIGYIRNVGGSYDYQSTGIRIFNYDEATNRIVLKSQFLFATTGGPTSATFGSMAIARYNNTGYIVVAGTDKYLYAYSPTGARLWRSNAQFHNPNYYGTILGIADFNNDGIPEVYTGDQIFSLSNGVKLCDGGQTNSSGMLYFRTGHSTMAADMNGDGKLDLVAGVNIYEVNITNNGALAGNSITLMPGMQLPVSALPANATRDGATQVVDIDNDGELEVVVISSTSTTSATGRVVAYVWKPVPGGQSYLMGSYLVPAFNVGYYSIPMMGNIDDDVYPEIVFITNGTTTSVNNTSYYWRMYALKFNPLAARGSQISLKWQLTHTDGSGCTGATLFDFNQDGRNEIVYRDEQMLRIIDGSRNPQTYPQDVLATFNNVTSATLREFPVIADIDGDGQAEIIVAGNTGSIDQNGFVRMFKTNSSPWAPARKVWNQYAYNAVNVNEDLTIPKVQLHPATSFPGPDGILGTADDVRPFNNFMQQQTLISKEGTPIWITPDARINTSTSTITVSGNDLIVNACFDNVGDAILGPPVYATLYSNSISSTTILAMDSINLPFGIGEAGCVAVTIPNAASISSLYNIIVRINDRNGKFAYFAECDSSNNEMSFINPFIVKKEAILLPGTTVDNGTYPNPVSILGNEVIRYTITATNPLASAVNITITDTIPAYLQYNGTSNPVITPTSTTTPPFPARQVMTWVFPGVVSNATVTSTFDATPQSGAVASQPLFINSAWVEFGSQPQIPTNNTYHQGAGIGIMTFSAGFGGNIYNAGEQALDYMTTPRSGIIIVPDEGYRFAGWSHGDYVSLRGATIKAQEGIMLYDTLTVYGNVMLHASFVPEEYAIAYYLNGGANAAINPEKYTIKSGAIELEDPQKEGDTFTGWTGSNGETPQQTVVIANGATGELTFYANYLRSGREDLKPDISEGKDKAWSVNDNLYVRTNKSNSIIRIFSLEGILRQQYTIVVPGITTKKLPRGIYIVTINNGIGEKIFIE